MLKYDHFGRISAKLKEYGYKVRKRTLVGASHYPFGWDTYH